MELRDNTSASEATEEKQSRQQIDPESDRGAAIHSNVGELALGMETRNFREFFEEHWSDMAFGD